jgi:hypothetical protein
MCGSGACVAGLVPTDAQPDDLVMLQEDLERLTGLSTTTTESFAG